MLKAKQDGTSLHLATSCGSLSLVLQCVSIRSWPTTLSIFPLQDGATTCNVFVKCEVMIVMFSFLEAAYVVWICAECGLPNKGKQGSTKFPGLHGGYSGLLMPRSWSLAHKKFHCKTGFRQQKQRVIKNCKQKLRVSFSIRVTRSSFLLSSVLVHLVAECISSCVLWINTTNKHKEIMYFQIISCKKYQTITNIQVYYTRATWKIEVQPNWSNCEYRTRFEESSAPNGLLCWSYHCISTKPVPHPKRIVTNAQ